MKSTSFNRGRLLHALILHSAALLVPGADRDEWLAEWKAELWYVRQNSCDSLIAGWRRKDVATMFCLGAFKDALWMRRNYLHRGKRLPSFWNSPIACAAFLMLLAASSLVVTFFILPTHDHLRPGAAFQQSMADFLFTIVLACPTILATTSLRLAEVPAGGASPGRHYRFRQWAFLTGKILVILISLYCGAHVLAYQSAPFIPAGIQIMSLFWGIILASHWSLRDQRRRCPICLHALSEPVWVGDRSRYFLEWNCTGLMCNSGHGLLYVPESPTSWFNRQRWACLDSAFLSDYHHSS